MPPTAGTTTRFFVVHHPHASGPPYRGTIADGPFTCEELAFEVAAELGRDYLAVTEAELAPGVLADHQAAHSRPVPERT